MVNTLVNKIGFDIDETTLEEHVTLDPHVPHPEVLYPSRELMHKVQ